MPAPAEVTATYRERYWAEYREEQVGGARLDVYVHTLECLESRLVGRSRRLVDVGCGGGTLLELAGARGWNAVGFDTSPQAVAHARARGLEAYTHAWPPSPLGDGTADACTFVNVLDHLRDPFLALREAWRVLRARGLIYVRVPNAPVHVRLVPLLRLLGAEELSVFHLFGFGTSALRYHLSRLGFEVLALGAAPPGASDPYGSGRLSGLLRAAGSFVHRAVLASGLDRRGWGLSIEALAAKVENEPTEG